MLRKKSMIQPLLVFLAMSATVCSCFLAVTLRSQERPATRSAGPALDRADLLGLLDCATRPDQLLAIKPESYSEKSFSVRYLYPVSHGRELNMLNMLRPAHWVAIALYHRDGHSAAFYEVGFDGPKTKRDFTLLDGANLEMRSGRWDVKNILNGGSSTWPEIAQHVDRLSALPATEVARNDVTGSTAACEFPPQGLEFVAVSPVSDRSPWKFKDGVSDGIKFKEQFGPFKNTDLKRTPFNTVFMISYGPS